MNEEINIQTLPISWINSFLTSLGPPRPKKLYNANPSIKIIHGRIFIDKF